MAEENKSFYQPTDYGQIGVYKPSNAYTSPAVFATDYTVIQQNLSQAGTAIMDSALKIQAERKKIEQDLRDSYNTYTKERLIEANKMMGVKVQDTMNANIESFEDFINMSEQQKQRALLSVDEFNNANKVIEKGMAEIGSYKLDLRDTNKPAVSLISEMQKGNSDAFEMVPYRDGRIGADYKLKLRDENGNFTGETVTITQDQIITQIGTLKDVEPVIKGLDEHMTKVASNMQSIINSSAARGVANSDAIVEKEVQNIFTSTIQDDTKETYYSNVINQGVDYHPTLNPATNKPWEYTVDKNGQRQYKERDAYYQQQDQEFTNYLRQQLKAQTYQPAVQAIKTETDKGSAKNLPFNQQLYSDVVNLKSQIDDSAKNKEKITQLPASKDMIGRPIMINGEQKQIVDTELKDGLFYVTYEGPYSQSEGGRPLLQQAFSLSSPNDLYYALRAAQGNVSLVEQGSTSTKALTAQELIAKYSK